MTTTVIAMIPRIIPIVEHPDSSRVSLVEWRGSSTVSSNCDKRRINRGVLVCAVCLRERERERYTKRDTCY